MAVVVMVTAAAAVVERAGPALEKEERGIRPHKEQRSRRTSRIVEARPY